MNRYLWQKDVRNVLRQMNIGQVHESDYFLNLHITLFLVLSGSIKILHNGRKISIHASEVYVIHSRDIVKYESTENNLVLTISIHEQYLDYQSHSAVLFRPLSAIYYRDEFKQISKSMATIYVESYHHRPGFEGLILSHLYQILGLLARVTNDIEDVEAHKVTKNNKIYMVTTYINDHFTEQLTLDSLSKHLFINKYYLAHEFKATLGMTIGQYLKEIRLFNATKDLIELDLTLTEIAYKNGFPNTRAFNSAFKEKYNRLPNEFRKSYEGNLQVEHEATDILEDMSLLNAYLDTEGNQLPSHNQYLLHMIKTNVNEIHTIRHQKQMLLKTGFQQWNLIRRANQELSIKLVSISHIDQLVDCSMEHNELHFNFTRLDQRIRACLELNYTPYLQLDAYDYERWERKKTLISFEAFILKVKYHLQSLFGKLDSWYIEFRCFYEKDVNSHLCMPLVQLIDAFTSLCQVVVHFPTIPEPISWMSTSDETVYCIDDYTGITSISLHEVKKLLSEHKFIEMIKESKNVLMQHQILTNFVSYESDSYISKYVYLIQANLVLWLHLKNQTNMTITPVSIDGQKIFENFPSQLAEHVSLCSSQGVIRESWYAYQFLGQLYDRIIYRDEYCIITKQSDNYRLLIFYPQDEINSFMHAFITTENKRVSNSARVPNLNVTFTLEGINGVYKITKQEITPHIVDKYVKFHSDMDASLLETQDIDYINAVNQPVRTIGTHEINEKYEWSIEVPILGIVYIQLDRIQ